MLAKPHISYRLVSMRREAASRTTHLAANADRTYLHDAIFRFTNNPILPFAVVCIRDKAAK
ncbi:hypothetical protein A9R05_04060 [Burkholderia sp. KK1]|nr:hypothetical protein A9R05_04060 [Burkholderia sp. KK1]